MFSPVARSGELYVKVAPFRQFCSRSARQFSQVPHESTMQPTPPMSPTLNLVTALPTACTRPMISWPGTQGYTVGKLLHSFRAWWMSEWQIPQYKTSSRTSFGPTARRLICMGPR